MIEVLKILHRICDKATSRKTLHLAQDRTRGHSLKLVTQHCKMEIRRNNIVSQSEWSNHGIRYLNLLCHPLLFRCLNPDWIKCGQISLSVRFCYKEQLPQDVRSKPSNHLQGAAKK